MIDVALKTLIAALPNVTPRVNPGSDMVKVTKDLPRVVYTLIDDPSMYTDSGVMGLRKAQYQLDVFAAEYDDARAIAKRITAAATNQTAPGLDGYKGTVDGTKILRIYFPSNSVVRADAAPGQNQAIARATVDVLIDYRELPEQPAPTP